MLVNMIIADQDEIYINKLAQWFRENRTNQFQIIAFTEKESLHRFLNETNLNIDVLLAEECFLEEKMTSAVNTLIVLGQPVKDYAEDLKYIDKYLPAPSLCSEILSLISDTHQRVWRKAEKSDLIICLSPDQKLKSTLALSLACVSNEYIYINYESFPIYNPVLDSYRSYKNLSNILYNIKASKDNIHMSLESAVYTDHNGINIIPPMDNPKDLWELSEEETASLIEALKAWGRFPRIIADIECSACPVTLQWLKAASVIFVPFDISQITQIRQLKKLLFNEIDRNIIKWVLAGECANEDIPEDFDSLFFMRELKPLHANNFVHLAETNVESLRDLISGKQG